MDPERQLRQLQGRRGEGGGIDGRGRQEEVGRADREAHPVARREIVAEAPDPEDRSLAGEVVRGEDGIGEERQAHRHEERAAARPEVARDGGRADVPARDVVGQVEGDAAAAVRPGRHEREEGGIAEVVATAAGRVATAVGPEGHRQRMRGVRLEEPVAEGGEELGEDVDVEGSADREELLVDGPDDDVGSDRVARGVGRPDGQAGPATWCVAGAVGRDRDAEGPLPGAGADEDAIGFHVDAVLEPDGQDVQAGQIGFGVRPRQRRRLLDGGIADAPAGDDEQVPAAGRDGAVPVVDRELDRVADRALLAIAAAGVGLLEVRADRPIDVPEVAGRGGLDRGRGRPARRVAGRERHRIPAVRGRCRDRQGDRTVRARGRRVRPDRHLPGRVLEERDDLLLEVVVRRADLSRDADELDDPDGHRGPRDRGIGRVLGPAVRRELAGDPLEVDLAEGPGDLDLAARDACPRPRSTPTTGRRRRRSSPRSRLPRD